MDATEDASRTPAEAQELRWNLLRLDREIDLLRAERNSVTYRLEQALQERERLHRRLDSLASSEEAAS